MNLPLLSDRCTGRTSRQLKALPDGSIYIVRDEYEKRHCLRLIRYMGRRQDAIRIVCTSDCRGPEKLRRFPHSTLWDIDHHAELPRHGDWRAILTRYRYAPEQERNEA
jgi:hypothetical protein